MARQTGGHTSAAYEEGVGAVSIVSRLVVIVSCVAAIGATTYGLWGPKQPVGTVPGITLSPVPSIAALAPSGAPSTNPLPSPVPSAVIPRIGVVAGHWGSDTGATCSDGLTEVEVNLDVAQRVVYILRALGYQADLLEEFDPRLEGYRVDALVSIHADSCVDYPNATPPASGFKVASVEDSLVPEAEARLVACLAQCYAARTGMYFHANSITYDMIHYHSFYEIDGRTPGAIIETGFMLNDRRMLTERPDLVAQGVADGIVCFIEGESAPP
ncbi:MAG: N-acetylmuramoyl-L-alanine amidase [Anaerolineae bacterium]